MQQPQSHAVDSRGLILNVLTWGRSDTPAVLLHHGFLDHARSWEPVARLLAEQYYVIAPDARGHGDSARVGAGGYYHFQDYTYDLDCVLRALSAHLPVLVGHSMGGMVCGYYCGTFPQQVRGYVSIEGLGPPDSDPETGPERMRTWIDGVRKKLQSSSRTFSSVRDAAARLQTANPRLTDETALFLAEHGTTQTDTGTFIWKFDPLHQTRSPQQFYVDQVRPFWRNIVFPALYIEGEVSPFARMLEDRSSELPDCSKRIVKDAAHMIHHEQPDALAAILSEFIATLPQKESITPS